MGPRCQLEEVPSLSNLQTLAGSRHQRPGTSSPPPTGRPPLALRWLPALCCRVVHGDRDVQRTLQRLSETVDWQDLLRVMSGRGMPDPPPASGRPPVPLPLPAAR